MRKIIYICIIFLLSGIFYWNFFLNIPVMKSSEIIYPSSFELKPAQSWRKSYQNIFNSSASSFFMQFTTLVDYDKLRFYYSIDNGKNFIYLPPTGDANARANVDNMILNTVDTTTSGIIFVSQGTKNIIIRVDNIGQTLIRQKFQLNLLQIKGTSFEKFDPFINVVANSLTDLRIIKRSEWGADETLRYADNPIWIAKAKRARTHKLSVKAKRKIRSNKRKRQYLNQNFPQTEALKSVVKRLNGHDLVWPIRKSQEISKIIIHHTAENIPNLKTITESDMKAAIRSIYYFHSIKRNWGDIGYNYIIDPFGNIYEGRAGGTSVRGAHTLWNNAAAIGIAVMGNFENKDIGQRQRKALEKLLVKLSIDNNLPLQKNTEFFRECSSHLCTKKTPLYAYILKNSIIGHRNAGYTICPGGYLYNRLADIRKDVLNILKKNNFIWAFEQEKVVKIPGMKAYLPQNQRRFGLLATSSMAPVIQIKNIGSKTWRKAKVKIILGQNNYRSVQASLKDKNNILSSNIVLNTDIPSGKNLTIPLNLQSFYNYPHENPIINIALTTNDQKFASFDISLLVAQGQFSYQIIKNNVPKSVSPHSSNTWELILKNTGSALWLGRGPSALYLYDDHGKQIGRMQEMEVAQNARAHFQINWQAGQKLGLNTLKIRPKIPQIGYLIGDNISAQINIVNQELKRPVQSKYNIQTIKTGTQEAFTLKIPIINNDIQTWFLPSIFMTSNNVDNFIIPPQAIHITPNTIKVGERGIISIKLISPAQTGSYQPVFHFWHLQNKIKERLFIKNIFKVKVKVSNDNLTIKNTIPSTSVNSSMPQTPQKNPKPIINSETKTNIKIKIPADKQKIRIKLSYQNKLIKLNFTQPVTVLTATGRRLGNLYGSKDFSIIKNKGIWQVKVIGTSRTQKIINTKYLRFVPDDPKTAIATITNWQRTPLWDNKGQYNDNAFRGIIEIHPIKDKLYLINELSLSNYLAGVAEEVNTAPTAKLRTMAIITRSYALFYLQKANNKFKDKPYDLDDSPITSQKYLGYNYELRSPNMAAAVQATQNKVVTYLGNLVKTPYFTQSNGYTKSAQTVWGWQDTPYLISVNDNYCQQKIRRGHGVGLSGCGATALAKLGWSAIKIIKHYYTGVKITTY